MKKSFQPFVALMAAFLLVISCFYSLHFTPQASEGADNTYLSDLSKMYEKYDKRLSTAERQAPYGLSRLLVSGWNGKNYGAVMTAYDRQNDFAVLQFSSPKKAQTAERKIKADGLCAEADAVAKFDAAEKCTLMPEYSERLGVPDFLSSNNMGDDEVIVAVVDSGMMYDHEVFTNRLYSTGVDLSGDNMENAYYDTQERGEHYGHATFIGGIIADNTPDNVKLLPVKIVQFETEDTSASAIIAGINYAVSEGASVINVSLGAYGARDSFEYAVNNAVSKGVMICASTGNDGAEVTERYPCCIENAIAVSALNANCDAVSNYSNYGDAVDFCAPGYRVNSAYPQEGASAYRTWSGTSFSTPYIAALCANIKTLDCQMAFDDVYQTLCDFAKDLGDSGRDEYYGNGFPCIGNMVYSGASYELKIPQGTLSVFASESYTEATQPWRRFAPEIQHVLIDSSVKTVGDYMFYRMESASFRFSGTFTFVGDYAFYGCRKLKSMRFGEAVERIGFKAFGDIEGFAVKGYRNTPAEAYALSEQLRFVKLGCHHSYYYEVIEPTQNEAGYTLYTCAVCGESYRSAYIESKVIQTGSCGADVVYTLYSTGKLVISGNGAMYDYLGERAPWFSYREELRLLEIQDGVTAVSPFAFYQCGGIGKVRVSDGNPTFATDGVSLFSKDKSALLLTFARGAYVLPETVSNISAPALLPADGISPVGNSCIYLENSVLYDSDGNLLAALPSYRERVLTLNRACTVKEYAFILSDYPERLESDVISLRAEPYSFGYTYAGALVPHGFTVSACAENPAVSYAESNGFSTETARQRCGDELTYTYDSTLSRLTISGSGAMTDYASSAALPWSAYISEIKSVVIGNGVSSVSPYAFNGVSSLTYLTMPLSLKAPQDKTVWEGCTAIQEIDLTYGTGRMDDYESESGQLLYSYTPWFISRLSLKKLTLDSEVKYIGKFAFRSCSVLTSLTLNSVEALGDGAFLACPKLTGLTILSKNVILPDYCILSYQASTRKLYSGNAVSGYADSTVKDYCDRLGAGFVSLGCGHSRSVTLLEETQGNTFYARYWCADCDEEFTEITDLSSMLCGTVTATSGYPVYGAEITAGGNVAFTDENGYFSVSGLSEGVNSFSLSCNGAVLMQTNVTVVGKRTAVSVCVRYADYVPDGVINAKDYAFALKNGYDDAELFDFGKISSGDNTVSVVSE